MAKRLLPKMCCKTYNCGCFCRFRDIFYALSVRIRQNFGKSFGKNFADNWLYYSVIGWSFGKCSDLPMFLCTLRRFLVA